MNGTWKVRPAKPVPKTQVRMGSISVSSVAAGGIKYGEIVCALFSQWLSGHL